MWRIYLGFLLRSFWAGILCGVIGFLIFLIADQPKYRYLAVVLLVLTIIMLLSLWRFLPSEREYVRMKAERIVERRLRGEARPGDAPTAHHWWYI